MKPFSAILTVMLAASLAAHWLQQFPDRKLHSGELFFLPVLQ